MKAEAEVCGQIGQGGPLGLRYNRAFVFCPQERAHPVHKFILRFWRFDLLTTYRLGALSVVK